MSLSPNEDSQDNTPFQGVADESFRQALIDSIKQLPERKASCFRFITTKELNLKEIEIFRCPASLLPCQPNTEPICTALRTKLSAWTQND